MFKLHSMSTRTSCQYFLPRNHWILLLACIAVAILGCGNEKEESASTNTGENQLPVISGSQLNQYLIDNGLPVLVEFGVDFNCSRCAQTKHAVVDLRESLKGEVDVIRVDFNSNAQTVAELGGTICPTYVLFDQGKPVLTRSFPVSIGVLEGDILRQFGK